MKKIKIKKLIKIFSYLLLCFGFMLLLAEFALRYLLPLNSIKMKTLAYVSQALGAEVSAGDISAGLLGVEIDNISLENKEKHTLFNCKNLQIALNPFKMLLGQLSIKRISLEEPLVQIIRYKDGSFNFDSLLTSDQKSREQVEKTSEKKLGVSFDIRIKNLQINKARIFYLDLKDEVNANIQNLNLAVKHFSFYKPFSLEISFLPYFKQKDLLLDDLQIALLASINLEEMQTEKATLELKNFLISYKDALLKLKAKVVNFDNPSITFNTEFKDISDNMVKDFIVLPSFKLPLTILKGNLNYFVQTSQVDIKNLFFKMADTELAFEGKLGFEKNLSAQGKIILNSVLDSLKGISPLVEKYQPTGQIKAVFDFALPLALKGNLTLNEIGFFTDKAGSFENFNGVAEVKSIDEIIIDSLSGLINKNPFTLQASYLKKRDFADIFFNFEADKLYLINTSKEITEEETIEQIKEEKALDTAQETLQKNASFVPLKVDGNIKINKIDIPFIRGNKLVFKTKARNITPLLDRTQGTFDMAIQDGQIKDVYTLANANVVTKVMFMSLGIVSKVINTLNVLDLLNGMGKILSGKKETEEDIPVHQEINGKMDFDSFETTVDFNQGLATMKKCSFVSDLFSFKVKGDINFDNRKINLNVDSAPGKHKEDGIMPLNIDIKGTIEEPTGSLSVLSSVSALVSNTITNNPVSNMLKNTWGKLFSSSGDETVPEQDEP